MLTSLISARLVGDSGRMGVPSIHIVSNVVASLWMRRGLNRQPETFKKTAAFRGRSVLAFLWSEPTELLRPAMPQFAPARLR